jgi:imidazole glycerol-phosphate synthase subunit HisH
MRRITVFDYEAGNLHSLLKAMAEPGRALSVRVETDARALVSDTDLLVLPGVGAFGHAAARLAPGRGEVAAALADGLPAIGICLGMQLLCAASDEGAGDGLGLVPGRVRKVRARRVPQIGWNTVEWREPSVVLSDPSRSGGESKDLGGGRVRDASTPALRAFAQHDGGIVGAFAQHDNGSSPHRTLPIAYFANGYVCAIDPDDPCVLATTTHEADRFASVVRVANTIGMQFHPEKSSFGGVRFLRAMIATALSLEPVA